jgi:hypothetical protein
MSLAAGIHDFMSTGLSVGDRIYPLHLPQGVALPAMVYRVISDDPSVTHSDSQDAPTYTGIRHSFKRIQFDCVAYTYDEAEALADELLDYAVGYSGVWGDEEIDSVRQELRLDDEDVLDGERTLYRVIQDLIVGHRAVPAP